MATRSKKAMGSKRFARAVAETLEAKFGDHADVLRRVEDRGDLFAPLLSEKQELPG